MGLFRNPALPASATLTLNLIIIGNLRQRSEVVGKCPEIRVIRVICNFTYLIKEKSANWNMCRTTHPKFMLRGQFFTEIWSGRKQVTNTNSFDYFRSEWTDSESCQLFHCTFTRCCFAVEKSCSTRRQFNWCSVFVSDKQTIIFIQNEQIKGICFSQCFQNCRHFHFAQANKGLATYWMTSCGKVRVTQAQMPLQLSTWLRSKVQCRFNDINTTNFGTKIRPPELALYCCLISWRSHVVGLW